MVDSPNVERTYNSEKSIDFRRLGLISDKHKYFIYFDLYLES